MLIILTFLKECSLTINLETTGFNVGDTFALPVTVKDYSRKDIVSASIYTAYANPIGRVPALVSILTGYITGMLRQVIWLLS